MRVRAWLASRSDELKGAVATGTIVGVSIGALTSALIGIGSGVLVLIVIAFRWQ